MLVAVLVAVAAAGYAWRIGGEATAKAKAKDKPATPVVVAKVTARTVPVQIQTIGTVLARATVSVRPQVDGQILESLFREGEMVEKGAALFRIDPRSFQAKLREAEANLARDQASLAKAKGDFQRYASLSGKGFSSQQKYEEARAAMNGLSATIQAAQAAVDLAKLNLEFATVRAPITGRTGSVLVQAGNIVKPEDRQPLVVINEIDPIHVSLAMPEIHLSEIKRRLAEGALSVDAAVSENDRSPRRGNIIFVNNAVDTQTGTILLKAEFDNKDGYLTPGQFVRVAIRMGALKDVPVVPERAIQLGQKGSYLFVVGKNMAVQPKNVTLGPSAEGFTVVGDGVGLGDTVVTDGQLRLFKGAKVTFKTSDVKAGKGGKEKTGKDKAGKTKEGEKSTPKAGG